MGVAKGINEDHEGVSAHRPGPSLWVGDELNDLPLTIRRGRRPRNCQARPHVRHSTFRGFRQLDLDRRAADRDAIDQVPNVGLYCGAVRGQFADGLNDERLDTGRNANDRSGFAPSPCRAACET